MEELNMSKDDSGIEKPTNEQINQVAELITDDHLELSSKNTNIEISSTNSLLKVHSVVFAAPIATVPKLIQPVNKIKVTSDKTSNSQNFQSDKSDEKDNPFKSNSLDNNMFPYKPPTWSGIPEQHYFVTILKDGLIKNTINLELKSHLTFGRFDTCDIFLEHPSCSRYHAVLQYCAFEEGKRKKGFYIFDLGSTHGTILNKKKIKPKVYNRVRVGYQLKFGGSTRLYIIEGPNEDQEEEFDIDILQKRMLEYEQHKKLPKSSASSKANDDFKQSTEDEDEDEGATWGFGEDAFDEGINLKDLFEKKKDIEIKDPKKTLRGFFEREGLELEYEMTERGSGSSLVHVAQVKLPIDVGDVEFVIAEGTSSNKKDAVLSCATDACKIIQAYDMLQNTSREDQKRKHQRELEANDFYESDEDSYLDRTGLIEKKRLKRKQRAGREENKEVETFHSLQIKLATKEKELRDCEERLERNKKCSEVNNGGDSLDAYMEIIGSSLDTNTKMNLKRTILVLKKEIVSLQKLVEKTKPTALPELQLESEKIIKDKEKESGLTSHNLEKPIKTMQETKKTVLKLEETVKELNETTKPKKKKTLFDVTCTK